MTEYDSLHLYEDAHKIKCNWQKWLPPDVYKFHVLIQKEVNAAVELQMGVLLPFISCLWTFNNGSLLNMTIMYKPLLD